MWYLLLNRISGKSLFKEAILKVFEADGDELILGYGFINLGNSFWKYNTEFIDTLKKNPPKKITILGKQNDDISNSVNNYLEFAKKINNEIIDVSIRVLIHSNNHYHKKIAVRFNEASKPIIALIGSSNLTKPAYVDNYSGTYNGVNYMYNQELDVILWNKRLLKADIETRILNSLASNKNQEKYATIHKMSELGINLELEFDLDDIIQEVVEFDSLGFKIEYLNDVFINNINENEIAKYIGCTNNCEFLRKLLIQYYELCIKNIDIVPNGYSKNTIEKFLTSYKSQFINITNKKNKNEIIDELNNKNNKGVRSALRTLEESTATFTEGKNMYQHLMDNLHR